MKRAVQAGLTLAVILVLTGCVKFSAALELAQDGTVDGAYAVAVKEGSGAALGLDDADAATQLLDDSGLLEGLAHVRTSGFSGGGFVGVEAQFRNQPLSEFALGTPGINVVREGDNYVVTSNISAISEEDAAALEGAQLTVAVTFPGPVESANGTVAGTTVTWDLVGGPEELHAVGAAQRSTSALPGVLTSLVVIVVAAGAWVASRRRLVARRARQRAVRYGRVDA